MDSRLSLCEQIDTCEAHLRCGLFVLVNTIIGELFGISEAVKAAASLLNEFVSQYLCDFCSAWGTVCVYFPLEQVLLRVELHCVEREVFGL